MHEAATGVWHRRAAHPDRPAAALTPEDVAARLRPLLDSTVEIVLPTDAELADRAALERALSM